MFNWGAFTLFLYIIMRMSGFVLFSPIFGRSGIPGVFKAGLSLMMAVSVYYSYGGTAEVPGTILELSVRLLLELGIGLVFSMVMRFYLYIAEQAGEIIDTDMGMSMAKMYDPGSNSSLTNTASLLNIMMLVLFFTADGHITLLQIMLTSGELIPFGAAAIGDAIAERCLLLFTECALLAVKLSFPIMAAELLGQVGMGVVMKAIPQINVFAINIELKIIIGLVMLVMLLTPISSFLLEAEKTMLVELRHALALMG